MFGGSRVSECWKAILNEGVLISLSAWLTTLQTWSIVCDPLCNWSRKAHKLLVAENIPTRTTLVAVLLGQIFLNSRSNFWIEFRSEYSPSLLIGAFSGPTRVFLGLIGTNSSAPHSRGKTAEIPPKGPFLARLAPFGAKPPFAQPCLDFPKMTLELWSDLINLVSFTWCFCRFTRAVARDSLAAPYRAILRYYCCGIPHRAIPPPPKIITGSFC